MKRKRDAPTNGSSAAAADDTPHTPTRRSTRKPVLPPPAPTLPATPSKRSTRTALPPSSGQPSPSPQKKPVFRTPQKPSTTATTGSVQFAVSAVSAVSPPPVTTNADRSARRKSARRIVARVVDGDASEDDDEDDEDELARRIYGSSSSSSSSDSESASGPEEADGGSPSPSPSKGARGRRKRQKGERKKKKNKKKKEDGEKAKEPTPPRVTEGYESYFLQNRTARQATSTATLASLPQLDHSTYFRLLREREPDHADERRRLTELHQGCFRQWRFELSQGFNVLLYGYGSKRKLLLSFAEYLASQATQEDGEGEGEGEEKVDRRIVVVNGYVPALTVKDVFANCAVALLGPEHTLRLGSTPSEALESILSVLSSPPSSPSPPKSPTKPPTKPPSSSPTLTLIINTIDGEPLRSERNQALLSRLAAHPKVSLVASTDHIRAPLLWDAARISQYNFLWHDATTFTPYAAEISADDVLALTGDAGRRGGGARGAKYVLASLPANAKRLFRVLVGLQVQGAGSAAEERAEGTAGRRAGAKDRKPGKRPEAADETGVEYSVLYHKAVAEFICSNDVAFRALLKEFVDHRMVSSRKDALGTEVLWAPFRRDELEAILEDLEE